MTYKEAIMYLNRAQKNGYVPFHSGIIKMENGNKFNWGINIDVDGSKDRPFGVPTIIFDKETAEEMFPSTRKREGFANKMKDPEFIKHYFEKTEKTEIKRRAESEFGPGTVEEYYVPLKIQYDAAIELLSSKICSLEQMAACNQIMFGYTNNEKIHRSYIHKVNEGLLEGSQKEQKDINQNISL